MLKFLCFLAVPPEIVKHPQNITVDEGDTIFLECEALGFPVPQITWYRNDSAVVANRSLVQIDQASKSEHEGLYRCEAENPAGIVTASAWVTVKGLCNADGLVILKFKEYTCHCTVKLQIVWMNKEVFFIEGLK